MILLAVVVTCQALVAGREGQKRSIIVDVSDSNHNKNVYGVWEGFGVSLCWWANVFADHDDVVHAAFSAEASTNVSLSNGSIAAVPGLMFNIARYNVGASSNTALANGSKMIASPNIPPWKQIEAFWVTPTSWDWNRDANQRKVLALAASLGIVDTIEVFSNSPVWWMTSNHNPSGSSDGLSDNLNGFYDAQHAEYIATVAGYLRNNLSLPVRSVELFNEPSADWWKASGSQEGCHIGPLRQMKVLEYLPAAMLQNNLPIVGDDAVRIAASDESFVDMAIATWLLFNASTKSLVQQVNVHGYEEGGDRAGLYDLVVRDSSKVLRDSEYGDGDGTGQTLIKSFMADWQLLHPRGWCYWQVVDVAGGWGMFLGETNDNASAHSIVQVNTKYFVIAHLSRHIRPGMTIVVPSDSQNHSAAAFQRSNNSKSNGKLELVALVVANLAATSSHNTTVDIRGFQQNHTSLTDVNISQWVTSIVSGNPDPRAAYHFLGTRQVRNFSGVFDVQLSPLTIVTIEITFGLMD